MDDTAFAPGDDDDLSVPEGIPDDLLSVPEEEDPNIPHASDVSTPLDTDDSGSNNPNDELETEEPTQLGRGMRKKFSRLESRYPRDRFARLAGDFNQLYSNKKFRYGALNNQFLASLNLFVPEGTYKKDQFASMHALCNKYYDFDNETYEWLHPALLSTKANSEDNPSWQEAMNGPLADGYWKAAEKEI